MYTKVRDLIVFGRYREGFLQKFLCRIVISKDLFDGTIMLEAFKE